MYAAGWGRLVHVSSVHGHRASAYKSAYVSAKHGLEGLSKVIALEARRQGRHQQHRLPRLRPHPARRGPDRRPGRAATASTRTRSSTQVLLARTPVKRLVEPDEVAGTRRLPLRPRHRVDQRHRPTSWTAAGPRSALTASPAPPRATARSTTRTPHDQGDTPCQHPPAPRPRESRPRRSRTEHRQGRLRQPDRHRRRVVRLLPLRLRRRPGLRHAVLPRRRPGHRAPCWPSAPTPSASSPARSAAWCSATSVTASAARRCSSSR